ncbi:MAG: hypothetical protein V1894_00850 [Chloroflexota bacterium]
MIIMKEKATPEEIQRVIEEVKRYGKPVVIRVPAWGFSNNNFKEGR